jgi:hypothetical protein
VKKLISVRLSDRDNELLKQLAEKLQMTQAEVISRALEMYAISKNRGKRMKKFRNNNGKYGDAGPFDAESKEELADEMMPTFELWAKEAAVRGETNDAESLVEEMRDEFISSLEEM